MMRVIAAFLFAPVVPFLLFGSFVGFASAAIFVLPVCYAAEIFFGIPLYFIVKKYSRLQRGYYCALLAAVAGALAGLVLELRLSSPHHSGDIGWFLPICGFLCGAISGAVFWLIVRRAISTDHVIKEESSNAKTY